MVYVLIAEIKKHIKNSLTFVGFFILFKKWQTAYIRAVCHFKLCLFQITRFNDLFFFVESAVTDHKD